MPLIEILASVRNYAERGIMQLYADNWLTPDVYSLHALESFGTLRFCGNQTIEMPLVKIVLLFPVATCIEQNSPDFCCLQMMSMGCGIVPMMFPGVHQYMPHMGMGIGMAMGMDMGMNRPMLPFPNMLSGSALPTPAAGAHLGPRFPMPTFHMPRVPAPDPSRISLTVQTDPLLSSLALQSQNQARIPNFIDPYQQYFGLRHMQLPLQKVNVNYCRLPHI